MAQLKDLIVTGDARVVGNNYTNNPKIAFGTCDTAAATAEKVVTISDPTWNLQVGDVIGVKFTNSNTAGTVKLNVNGTGAIQLAYNTSRPFTGSDNWITGYANRTIFYQYDGTYWYWITAGYNQNGDTYTTAKSWTAAATAAKTATCHDYAAQANSWIIVQMVYANTSASALTLNINNQGAKPIYINGSASSSSNYTLPKAHYLVFYNGTNYYFRTDGKIQGSITGDAATVNGKTVGVSVPSDAKFTDTTYSSKSASSGGTDVSLVTTGEKYTWNNKSDASNIKNGSATGSLRTVGSKVEDSEYTIGQNAFAEGNYTMASGNNSHAEGSSTKAIGLYAHAEGYYTQATNDAAHAEGHYTQATNSSAHAEGYYSKATYGYSHAEGGYTEATSYAAHAEGYQTKAKGTYSHTEGSSTVASNNSSHAEGTGSHATGSNAHAEGECTYAHGNAGAHAEGALKRSVATGTITAIDETNLKVTVSGLPTYSYYKYQLFDDSNSFDAKQYISNVSNPSTGVYTFTLAQWDNSLAVNGSFNIAFRSSTNGYGAHAEGYGTYAGNDGTHTEGIGTCGAGQGQHVQGKWNIPDNSYADIVGNGSAHNARSNAYTLDWNGNGTYAGKITVGADPTNNMDVATKQYVDALISSGSNSNGTWMRIGNFQICWHNFATRQTGSSSTWGTTYWSTNNSWTYPQAFSAAPTVTVSALDNLSGLFGASLNGAPSTTSVTVETYGSGTYTSSDLKIYCIAVGFWQ